MVPLYLVARMSVKESTHEANTSNDRTVDVDQKHHLMKITMVDITLRQVCRISPHHS